MSKGYAEGPAAEEAQRRLEELAEGPRPVEPPEREAVYGATEDDPERHFLGWVGEVDPDELFESGRAWGITIVRRRVAD
ncbi:MAG TPA: hypothetical protein VFB26_04215 [Gaiellaceae bacterium]|nr:hypothetical protein [Gaiellaceae bacterium]